jgi:hypothetical protein
MSQDLDQCDCGYTVKDCHYPLALAPLAPLIIPERKYFHRLLVTPMADGKSIHGYLLPIMEAMYDGMDEFRRGVSQGADWIAEEEDILVQLVDKARDISHVMAFVVNALDSEPQRDKILEAEKQYAVHCDMMRAAHDAAWIAHCKVVQEEMARMRAAEDPIKRV